MNLAKKAIDPAVTVEVKKDLTALYDDFELTTFIPENILHHFGPIAKRLGVHEIAMLPMILATASTAMHQSHIQVNATWLSTIGVYAVLVGNKGSGKTGVFKYFKKDLATVEKERAMANKEPEIDSATPSKKQKFENDAGLDLKNQIILETSTKEGLLQVLSQNGGVGCLLSDEYRTVLESMKSYGNDGGAEFMSRFVQLFDGDEIRQNTKGDGLLLVEEPHLSIAGCTQVNTLLNYFKQMLDTQGYWDRHRFFFAPDVYTLYREKLMVSLENLIKFTDVLRVLFDVHDSGPIYKIDPSAEYLIADNHDALQSDRENLQFELDGDDRVGQRAKAFGVLVRVAAVYQGIENAINLILSKQGTTFLNGLRQEPSRTNQPGPSSENQPGPSSRNNQDISDEMYNSQSAESESEDDNSDEEADVDEQGDGPPFQVQKYPGWNFSISEKNLQLAQELCTISTLTFEVMKKAATADTPSTPVVGRSAIIDLDQPMVAQREFVKEHYKAVAALHNAKKNDDNETTVRQMGKLARNHPVGIGQDKTEEYVKLVKLLELFGLVIFTVIPKGMRTEQRIKVLTSDERDNEANLLVEELKTIFKEKNPGQADPFI